MLSNRKIDLLGNLLKQEVELNEQQFKGLLSWRNSYSSTLEYYHKRLEEKIEAGDVVLMAKRLKRIESIKAKLGRFSTMRLSTLQDVAGLRVVTRDAIGLDKAIASVRNSETKNVLRRLDDYHGRPKADGYRGVHLVYQNRETSKMVEIQLRTELEHVWATAVEIYGTLLKTPFKIGQGPDEWKQFFQILSSYFAVLENSMPLEGHEKLSKKQMVARLKKSLKKLQVIERLNAATSGIEVVMQKRSKGRLGKYALVVLDYLSGKTSVDVFPKKDFEKAVREYTDLELKTPQDAGKDIVLVNIEDLDSLKKAYPNYFLSANKLLQLLSKVVLGQA